jgi:hypothetical protein
MGLLDEAIREHLELKRRRGADPGEIAQAAHEALEPIFPEEPVLPTDGAAEPQAEMAADVHAYEGDDRDLAAEQQEVGPTEGTAPAGRDFSNVGQETAEIDMQAVLDGDVDYALEPSQSVAHRARPVRAAPAAQTPQQGESMEWEMSGSADRGEVPEEIPGQERLSFE